MNKYVVKHEYTLKEVMESFDENKERVALVENDKKKIIGVVSQGDIIRALVSGMNLYTKVKQFLKPSFIYLREVDYEKAYMIFKEKKITLLPIIDDEAKLISIITLGDIFRYLEEKKNV